MHTVHLSISSPLQQHPLISFPLYVADISVSRTLAINRRTFDDLKKLLDTYLIFFSVHKVFQFHDNWIKLVFTSKALWGVLLGFYNFFSKLQNLINTPLANTFICTVLYITVGASV